MPKGRLAKKIGLGMRKEEGRKKEAWTSYLVCHKLRNLVDSNS